MDGIMHSNCAFLQHGLQIMSENSLIFTLTDSSK